MDERSRPFVDGEFALPVRRQDFAGGKSATGSAADRYPRAHRGSRGRLHGPGGVAGGLGSGHGLSAAQGDEDNEEDKNCECFHNTHSLLAIEPIH
jgi:hypothetical protein